MSTSLDDLVKIAVEKALAAELETMARAEVRAALPESVLKTMMRAAVDEAVAELLKPSRHGVPK
jgi:hypothetical protein